VGPAAALPSHASFAKVDADFTPSATTQVSLSESNTDVSQLCSFAKEAAVVANANSSVN
jgi:hypothetical protein